MRILLTSGATREPIDGVRFISNISTGSTGAALADALAAASHTVELLCGEGAVRPRHPEIHCTAFGSTDDLGEKLRARLGTGDFDVVIQAAAVADYRPESPQEGKVSSDALDLALRLLPTPKLLPRLKSWSPRPLRVMGFKLTAGADALTRAVAVGRIFAAGGVDAVVHNDLSDLGEGATARVFRLYREGDSSATAHAAGVSALADWLTHWVRQDTATPWGQPAAAAARPLSPAHSPTT